MGLRYAVFLGDQYRKDFNSRPLFENIHERKRAFALESCCLSDDSHHPDLHRHQLHSNYPHLQSHYPDLEYMGKNAPWHLLRLSWRES